MATRERDNDVKIEGILSENNLKEMTYTSKTTGAKNKAITGELKIMSTISIDGEDRTVVIPVRFFQNELTKKGTQNPIYVSLQKVMTEYTSIAASDIEHADRVRIDGATLTMQEYYNRNGNLSSFPSVQGTFVNKVRKEDCQPSATFAVKMVIGQAGFKTDDEGVENPNIYEIKGLIPQYSGMVDVIPFMVTNPVAIERISQSWAKGDTVKAVGKLNFSTITKEVSTPVDFGEPIKDVRTFSISELLITGGTENPLDGEFAISNEAIENGLKLRNAHLEELKTRKNEKPAPAAASTGAKKGLDLNSFGF